MPPNDGDPSITTDDWTVVDAGNNTDFQVPPTLPNTATSKQLRVSRDHPCGVPPETKDNRERGGDGVLSLPSNHLGLSEVVSDCGTHPKGQVATLSPA